MQEELQWGELSVGEERRKWERGGRVKEGEQEWDKVYFFLSLVPRPSPNFPSLAVQLSGSWVRAWE